VKLGLTNLQKYARILKKQRESQGAVDLASLDGMQISVDNKSNPTKIETHDDSEIHHTVAEWMIFANHV
jgi:exoribonuclease R